MEPVPSASVFFASFAVIQFGRLGFARFCSVCEVGRGFLPRVSLHSFFNCTHVYSAILTYSHIKK
jgi:hypothetical protein